MKLLILVNLFILLQGNLFFLNPTKPKRTPKKRCIRIAVLQFTVCSINFNKVPTIKHQLHQIETLQKK